MLFEKSRATDDRQSPGSDFHENQEQKFLENVKNTIGTIYIFTDTKFLLRIERFFFLTGYLIGARINHAYEFK